MDRHLAFQQARRQDLANATARLNRAPELDAHVETFDPYSGQMFAEMVVSSRQPRGARSLSLRANDSERKVHHEPSGPPSLESICRRSFTRYLEELPTDTADELVELLREIPWPIGQKLWKDAEKADLAEALAVWQAFTKVYKDNKHVTYHKAYISRPSPEDLPVYIRRMTSTTFDWLVCVTITDPNFRRHDIVDLHKLVNLAILDIGQPTTYSNTSEGLVTDRVIREWSIVAEESGAFPKLQALLIRDQPEVTHMSLTFLNNFPSLVLFGVKNCFRVYRDTRALAETYGWTTEDEHGILQKIEDDIKLGQTWDCAMTACYRHTNTMLSQPSIPKVEKQRAGSPIPAQDHPRPHTTSTTSSFNSLATTTDSRDTHTADKPVLSFRFGMTHTSILMPSTIDKMTFFRSTSTTFEPTEPLPTATTTTRDRSNTNDSSRSVSTPRLPLHRATTRRLKRKERISDLLQAEFELPRTTAPSPTPDPAARRSMPPQPPGQPVRSTSNFELLETTSAQGLAASFGQAPVPRDGGASGEDGEDAKGSERDTKSTKSH